MARTLPFQVTGCCIDCGNPHERASESWRCFPCDRAVASIRRSATGALLRAIRKGHVVPARSLLCVDCGEAATDYDHRDYSRPLDVQPVCRKCNQRRGPAIWRSARIAQPEA